VVRTDLRVGVDVGTAGWYLCLVNNCSRPMAILIRRLTLRNYKSIAKAAVDLSDLTVLVGPNGVGKSNVVDALRFVADSLDTTLDLAIRQRGGIGAVRRHSAGHPTHFAIAVRFHLGGSREAHYAFEIGARPNGAFVVQHEQASVSEAALKQHYFDVREGELVAGSEELRAAAPKGSGDRLYLTSVSGVPAFRPLYDALAGVASYNINPAAVREVQPHDPGERLARDGSNLAAVIKRLQSEAPRTLDRIQQYLQRIVPDIERVEHQAVGPKETLVFRQRMRGQDNPWRFYASSMSDGTLRSLGVLVALFQPLPQDTQDPPLITIEEPEATVHPGAAATIMDALVEAARTRQIVTTTHSPDLLDHPALTDSLIYSVDKVEGETIIAPVDEASLSSIKDGLYTPGELLRYGQLQPDLRRKTTAIRQTDLFEVLPE
jgi:predicted ATPase